MKSLAESLGARDAAGWSRGGFQVGKAILGWGQVDMEKVKLISPVSPCLS